jgi:hypothetical protein
VETADFKKNWDTTEISKSFWDSDKLHMIYLKGGESFAHVLESWNLILTKLLNFEHLYIYYIAMFEHQ